MLMIQKFYLQLKESKSIIENSVTWYIWHFAACIINLRIPTAAQGDLRLLSGCPTDVIIWLTEYKEMKTPKNYVFLKTWTYCM
jgi:hypothetical protein